MQAHDRLINMNDPEKGGSKYLQTKITNARELLMVPPSGDDSAETKSK